MNHRDDAFFSPQMTFLAGLGVGMLVHMFLPEEAKQRVDTSVKNLAQKLPTPAEVMPGATRAADNLFDTYQEVKDQTVATLRNSYKRWQDIDMDKYQETVDEVLQTLTDEGRLDQREVKRLRNYLVNDFDTFRAKTFQQ